MSYCHTVILIEAYFLRHPFEITVHHISTKLHATLPSTTYNKLVMRREVTLAHLNKILLQIAFYKPAHIEAYTYGIEDVGDLWLA